MGKVIVVTSGKGGVGKTTATANVGGALTKLGKKVLLVDMDVGLRNPDLEKVKEAIAALATEFGYVFLDSPAGIEHGFDASNAPAEQALVVVTPDVTSVRDADRVIGLLENKGVRNCGLVVNKYDRTLIDRKKQLTSDDIVDVLGRELMGIVPDDKAIIDATNRGEILVLSQSTPAAAAYLEIAHRLEGDETHFSALSTGRSLLNIFRRQK
jgi:septum site-determining protein MinD